MKLLPNWKRVLRKAWSMRFMLLAGVLAGCEAVLTAFGPDFLPMPPWARMVVVMVVIFAAFVSRLVAQKDIEE